MIMSSQLILFAITIALSSTKEIIDFAEISSIPHNKQSFTQGLQYYNGRSIINLLTIIHHITRITSLMCHYVLTFLLCHFILTFCLVVIFVLYFELFVVLQSKLFICLLVNLCHPLGYLYESTGLYKQSSLQIIHPDSGTVVKKVNIASNLFGEGIAVHLNRYQH